MSKNACDFAMESSFMFLSLPAIVDDLPLAKKFEQDHCAATHICHCLYDLLTCWHGRVDLAQNGCLDIGQRNLLVCAAVFHHIPTVACTSGREGRSTNPAPALLFPFQLKTKQMKRLSNCHGYTCGHIIHVTTSPPTEKQT